MNKKHFLFLLLASLLASPIFALELSPIFCTSMSWGEAGFVLDINPNKNPMGRMDGSVCVPDLTVEEMKTGLGFSYFPIKIRFSENDLFFSFLNAKFFWNSLHNTEHFFLGPYISCDWLGVLGQGEEQHFSFTHTNLEAGLSFTFRKKTWKMWSLMGDDFSERVPAYLNYVSVKAGVRYENQNLSYFAGISTDTLFGFVAEVVYLIALLKPQTTW